MIFRAYFNGLRQGWRLKKIVLLLWLFNLIWALLFLNPYMKAFRGFFSHRLVGHLLARENIYTYYNEFYFFMKPAVQAARQALSVGDMLFLLFLFLLGGGIVYAFLQETPVTLRAFWRQTGYFAGRLLRLFVLVMVLFLILGVVALIFALPAFGYAANNMSETHLAFALLWTGLVGIFFLTVFLLLTDLSRLYLVHHDAASVWRSLWEAFRSFFRNPVAYFFTYLLYATSALIGFIIYFIIQRALPAGSPLALMAGFLWLQLAIFFRYWVRISRFGAAGEIWLTTNGAPTAQK